MSPTTSSACPGASAPRPGAEQLPLPVRHPAQHQQAQVARVVTRHERDVEQVGGEEGRHDRRRPPAGELAAGPGAVGDDRGADRVDDDLVDDGVPAADVRGTQPVAQHGHAPHPGRQCAGGDQPGHAQRVEQHDVDVVHPVEDRAAQCGEPACVPGEITGGAPVPRRQRERGEEVAHLHPQVRRPQPLDQRAVLQQQDVQVGRQVPGHVQQSDLGAAEFGGVPEHENLHLHAPGASTRGSCQSDAVRARRPCSPVVPVTPAGVGAEADGGRTAPRRNRSRDLERRTVS